MNVHDRQHGFTLIEVMIVVAIVAILASLAYPAYTNYVVKTKRSVAKSLLTQIANRQEQYFLDNKAYADDLDADLNYSADPLYVDENSNPSTAGSAVYAISISAQTARTFTLSAVPQNAQAAQDTRCGTLTLDHRGTKGVSGPGSVNDCW